VLDIYIGDEHYGESPLHMAIANGDKDMVKFIMKIAKEKKVFKLFSLLNLKVV